jgi:predicted RNA binding protein YcfA (HicA-like mRNA interferase family)
MGSKYPVLKPGEVISVLSKFGFYIVSQRGSHIKLRKDGNVIRTVIIPYHYEVARGTLQSIVEQSGLTFEEFISKL